MNLQDEIKRREPIFQHPEFGTTQTDFENMTSEVFYGIDGFGRRYSRAQAITTALAMYEDPKYQGIHSWPENTWEIGKFEWQKVANNKILVTYLLLTRNNITRRTSLWHIAGKHWRIMFHQATPVQP